MPASENQRWTESLWTRADPAEQSRPVIEIGVLRGEGVGPEVVDAALSVLKAVAERFGIGLKIEAGGAIGRDAEREGEAPLTPEVIDFIEDQFSRGGAILNGPGGGRYVYDLRERFDLFFKISPLRARNALASAARLKPEVVEDFDILVVRENTEGIYQGEWDETEDPDGCFRANHRFWYSETAARRFVQAAARLAATRSGRLAVVWKESGMPSVSRLWQRCAEDAASEAGIDFTMVDIDLMAYRLIQDPEAFDIVAAPNLCGDVLGDLGAVLLGSRGLSFSGNFGMKGEAVYQTNHGSAYDLAGQDRANPAGQIFAVAMMLRESFGLWREAAAIEGAVQGVWAEGWRTEDVAVSGSRIIGTREMGRRIAEAAHGNVHEPAAG